MKYRLERGDQPINRVDELSLHHDLRYEFYSSPSERFRADVQYIGGAVGIVFGLKSSWRERGEAVLVGSIMTAKLVTNVFNPFKKLALLGRSFKSLKEFKLLGKLT